MVSQTFKIVEETSRNLIQATKSANEDLAKVLDVNKLDKKFQDMITVELNKKQAKLHSWKEYLEESGLLHVLNDENRSKLLEASQIIKNIQEIRLLQREYASHESEAARVAAKAFFKNSFALFLSMIHQ